MDNVKIIKLEKATPESVQEFIIDDGGRQPQKVSVQKLTDRKAQLQKAITKIDADIAELNKL